MKKKNKFYIIGTLMISLIIIGATIGYFGTTIQNIDTIKPMQIKQREWSAILGDGDPGGDASGFMYAMNYPHQADPATAYSSNLSNATAYEYSDSLNTEMIGETPYDTTYDIVYKYRVNDTVAYDISNATWRIDWVRSNLSIDFTSQGDVSNQAMEIVEIANTTDFMYFHVYLQDSDGGAGTGFVLTHGEKFNYTSLMEGYS